MKKLQCVLCGSTVLIDGDLAVCTCCGTKFQCETLLKIIEEQSKPIISQQ